MTAHRVLVFPTVAAARAQPAADKEAKPLLRPGSLISAQCASPNCKAFAAARVSAAGKIPSKILCTKHRARSVKRANDPARIRRLIAELVQALEASEHDDST